MRASAKACSPVAASRVRNPLKRRYSGTLRDCLPSHRRSARGAPETWALLSSRPARRPVPRIAASSEPTPDSHLTHTALSLPGRAAHPWVRHGCQDARRRTYTLRGRPPQAIAKNGENTRRLGVALPLHAQGQQGSRSTLLKPLAHRRDRRGQYNELLGGAWRSFVAAAAANPFLPSYTASQRAGAPVLLTEAPRPRITRYMVTTPIVGIPFPDSARFAAGISFSTRALNAVLASARSFSIISSTATDASVGR